MLLMAPATAAAQPGSAGPAISGWDVEIYGGWLPAGSASADAPTLPTSEPFVALNGQPSRRVPSWFFGDGADLLNDVFRQSEPLLGRNLGRITPIDDALAAGAIRRSSGPASGGRLVRRLNATLALEIDVGLAGTAWEYTEEAEANLAMAETSFEDVWNAFLADVPRNVTSVGAIRSGSGHQVLATGALAINLGSIGAYQPYVVVGGGWAWEFINLPAASLRGRYQFTAGAAPFDEEDTVDVHYEADTSSILGIVGAGVRRRLSSRLGVRLDGRLYLRPSGVTGLLDANSSAVLQPEGELTQFGVTTPTSPSLVINNRATGNLPPSSLGLRGFNDFETFTGGLRTQFRISGSLVIAF